LELVKVDIHRHLLSHEGMEILSKDCGEMEMWIFSWGIGSTCPAIDPAMMQGMAGLVPPLSPLRRNFSHQEKRILPFMEMEVQKWI
jgi:hypothetical protein